MSLQRLNPKRDGNEKGIIRALRECGCDVFQMSQRGLPDLLCFWGQNSASRAFLVEVKRHGNAPLTEDQEDFHRQARFFGWPVFVVHDETQVLDIVNKVSARRPKA